MRIDASNCEIINTKEISVHDCIFRDIHLDYEKKELSIVIIGTPYAFGDGKEITIRFCNVLGFNMTMCDFWGISPRLNTWQNIERTKQRLLPKLYQEKQNDKEAQMKLNQQAMKAYPIQNVADYHDYSRLADNKEYVESTFFFVSGDDLTIVCEFIIFVNPD